MKLKLFRLAVALAFASLFAPLSSAQTTAAQLYRLNEPASFSEGCLPPCLCPIALYDELYGTFTLKSTGADPQRYVHYAVGNVNWSLTQGGNDVRITGSGEYIVGGPLVIRQRLQLDLSFDNQAPIHFDSGLITGGGTNPIAIDIAQNGFYCFDRVFSVNASPVSASEFVPYQLRRTTYDEGCFDPCDCALLELPVTGSFNLLDLRPTVDPVRKHYAVLNASWSAISLGTPPGRSWSGFGIYITDAGTGQQRLTLDLKDQAATLRRYASGLVGSTVDFPRINIAIAVNGFYCFDYAFFLNAAP